MKVFGISPAHDSSVCLYEDGKIVSFYKEERITKKKRDSYPLRSMIKVLEKNKDIDAFAYCSVLRDDNVGEFDFVLSKFLNNKSFTDLGGDHHLQHASLAFYNSGFSEAAVVVIDRNGSNHGNNLRESETIFYCSYPFNFVPVYKNYWSSSSNKYIDLKRVKEIFPETEVESKSTYGLVKVYESATTLIGQDALENGKTMGLSAYGDKNKKYPDFFINKTNIVNDYYFSEGTEKQSYPTVYSELQDISVEVVDERSYQEYADFAWQVQKQTQEAAAYLIKKAIEKTGTKNIILTGGYALNVVANNFYLKSFPDINFYIEPIADDSGNSIGGAMLLYRHLTGDDSIYPIHTTFVHGEEPDLSLIKGSPIGVEGVCDLLIDNLSIGMFQGKAEAGPRALGHRSILFNALHPDAKNIVNRIKKREWYRPFAAMVLEEDAYKYFDMAGILSSPYMTISFEAFSHTKKLFPGVVHVDGTCRIQTVSLSDGEIYHLLKTMKEKTGHGILLNTSFNLAGKPLVDSVDDALETMNASCLDAVWFPEIEKIIFKGIDKNNNFV